MVSVARFQCIIQNNVFTSLAQSSDVIIGVMVGSVKGHSNPFTVRLPVVSLSRLSPISSVKGQTYISSMFTL